MQETLPPLLVRTVIRVLKQRHRDLYMRPGLVNEMTALGNFTEHPIYWSMDIDPVQEAPGAATPEAKAEPPSEKKADAPEPAEPKQKGGAQYRRALTLEWNKPEAPATSQVAREPVIAQPNMGQVAAEFLEQLELFREGLDAEGRDLSEDEVRAVKEE